MKISFLRHATITAVGGGLGIGLMVALATLAGVPALMIPFTTSIVLVMAAPDSPLAQPRNIVGGHVLSALCGLAVAMFGTDPWLAAVAVGLSIMTMQLTDTLHPPAGINAFAMVTANLSWTWVVVPVTAGALVLVGFAWGYHRLTRTAEWPRSWWWRSA